MLKLSYLPHICSSELSEQSAWPLHVWDNTTQLTFPLTHSNWNSVHPIVTKQKQGRQWTTLWWERETGVMSPVSLSLVDLLFKHPLHSESYWRGGYRIIRYSVDTFLWPMLSFLVKCKTLSYHTCFFLLHNNNFSFKSSPLNMSNIILQNNRKLKTQTTKAITEKQRI